MSAPLGLQLLAGPNDRARRLLDLAHDYMLAADGDRTPLMQEARRSLSRERFLRFEMLCEAVADWMRWQWKCDDQSGSAVEADDRVLASLFAAAMGVHPCSRCTVTAQHIGQMKPAAAGHIWCAGHRAENLAAAS